MLSLFVALSLAAPPADSVAARADRYLAARTALGAFSGAAVIARAGVPVYAGGHGYADFGRATPFTPDTRIPIASLSKMFTAMAALRLEADGKLRLSDTLDRYGYPGAWKAITLEHLIQHSSGIPDYEESLGIGSPRYFEEMTRPDASARQVEWAKRLPLSFEPGTKMHYSNTGYLVLGQIVEKASGQSFETHVTNTLLEPAGMTRSGVFGRGTRPQGLALGYTHKGLGWARTLGGVALTDTAFKRVPDLPLSPPSGDGGMYSTVLDLARWSRVMDRDPLASKALTPGPFGYAAGWIIDRAFDRTRQRHGGVLPGALSSIARFPDDSLTIVVVTNQDRARIEKIMRDLTAIALGEPFDLPVRGRVATLAPDDYARLEGSYDLGDGRAFVVKKDDDLLTVALEGRFTAGLIPLGPTEFYFPLGDGRATFTLDSAGRAQALNLRYDGTDHEAKRR